MKIVVGISGGVDSGVAALLLIATLVAQHLLDPWLRRKLEQQVTTPALPPADAVIDEAEFPHLFRVP